MCTIAMCGTNKSYNKQVLAKITISNIVRIFVKCFKKIIKIAYFLKKVKRSYLHSR